MAKEKGMEKEKGVWRRRKEYGEKEYGEGERSMEKEKRV